MRKACELYLEAWVAGKQDSRQSQIAKMEAAKVDSTLLVALHVAAHGPFVVPADQSCCSGPENLIDFDLLLRGLKDVRLPKGSTCCVWVILDTCRTVLNADQHQPACSQRIEDAASFGRGSGSRARRQESIGRKPDFLHLLACGPGEVAYDADSLSSALLDSLQRDGISTRDACEEGKRVKQASQNKQKPWNNSECRRNSFKHPVFKTYRPRAR